MRTRRALAAVLVAGALLALMAPAGTATQSQCGPSPDLAAVAHGIQENLRREYSEPLPFTYKEKRRDIEISKLGKVSVGPLRTFEVYPGLVDDYKRLIAVDDKPLEAAELARRDAEHQRNQQRKAERERAESPERRAARLAREAEEVRERQAILDDAGRVFALTFVCRETFQGDTVLVLDLKPQPHARVTTREGAWMKKSAGRAWVTEAGSHVARIRFHAFDALSIGWGVVARVEPGSGFDYVRKRVGQTWLPSRFTLEGSGRTLLFRRFEVSTVTTYSDHQPYAPAPGG